MKKEAHCTLDSVSFLSHFAVIIWLISVKQIGLKSKTTAATE